jgi:hypothetical protein
LQLAARLRPQLLDERPPSVGIRLERIGLTLRTVEGDDQLASRTLAVRLQGDELFQLGHECCVPSEREIGVDPVLERSRPELLEVRCGTGYRLSREVGERRAAPEGQCAGQAFRRERWFGAARVVNEPQEAVEVELAVCNTKQVSGRLGHEPLAELFAQAAEMVLERRKRRRGWFVAPDAGDESIDGHDAVRVEQEQREDRPPAFAAEWQHTLGVSYLQRAEDAELHRPSLVRASRLPLRGSSRLS